MYNEDICNDNNSYCCGASYRVGYTSAERPSVSAAPCDSAPRPAPPAHYPSYPGHASPRPPLTRLPVITIR